MVVLQQCLQKGVHKSNLTDQDKSMQFWPTVHAEILIFLSTVSYAAGCTVCLLLRGSVLEVGAYKRGLIIYGKFKLLKLKEMCKCKFESYST